MGPQFVREFGGIITAIEAVEEVKVLVFESAVEGFFLNRSDLSADLTNLTSVPQGPTDWKRDRTSSSRRILRTASKRSQHAPKYRLPFVLSIFMATPFSSTA
jgi:hypothetical protein